jgi:hypothetical protein
MLFELWGMKGFGGGKASICHGPLKSAILRIGGLVTSEFELFRIGGYRTVLLWLRYRTNSEDALGSKRNWDTQVIEAGVLCPAKSVATFFDVSWGQSSGVKL